MTKNNPFNRLRHPLTAMFACVMAVLALRSLPAVAGSIAINDRAPNTHLVYRDDAGNQTELRVSWSEMQTLDKVKKYIERQYPGRDYPFMLDIASRNAQIFIREEARYVQVAFDQL